MLRFLFAIFVLSSTVSAQSPEIVRKIYPEHRRDRALEAAIRRGLTASDDYPIEYIFNRVGLNGDGVTEVLVYTFGRGMCGTSGCDAAVFKKSGTRYVLVTHFEPVRNPILVSQHSTNGWRDLIFFNVAGGIIDGYYSVARFNGRTYYDNPTVERHAPPLRGRIRTTSYLSGKAEKGITLMPKGTR